MSKSVVESRTLTHAQKKREKKQRATRSENINGVVIKMCRVCIINEEGTKTQQQLPNDYIYTYIRGHTFIVRDFTCTHTDTLTCMRLHKYRRKLHVGGPGRKNGKKKKKWGITGMCRLFFTTCETKIELRASK